MTRNPRVVASIHARLETLLSTEPGNPWFRAVRASALARMGELDAARALIIELAGEADHPTPVLSQLAMLCTDIGEFELSARLFEASLAVSKDQPGTVYNYVIQGKGAPAETLIPRIEAWLHRGGLRRNERASLLFSLARLYDRSERYDDAFTTLNEANATLVRNYRHNAEQQRLDRIRKVVDQAFVKRTSAHGDDSALPVFVFGMPRSGTSLTEQILASHTDVAGVGETGHVPRAMAQVSNLLDGTPVPECLLSADDEFLGDLGNALARFLAESAPGAKRVTDKSISTWYYLGIMYCMMPKATYLHCLRNPVDNAVSIYFQRFTTGHDYAYDLRDIARCYALHRDMVDFYKPLMGDRFLEVKYHETVEDHVAAGKRLLKACDMPWDDACEAFWTRDSPVLTASKTQVRRKPYTTSIQRWKRYERHLTPLLDELDAQGVTW